METIPEAQKGLASQKAAEDFQTNEKYVRDLVKQNRRKISKMLKQVIVEENDDDKFANQFREE